MQAQSVVMKFTAFTRTIFVTLFVASYLPATPVSAEDVTASLNNLIFTRSASASDAKFPCRDDQVLIGLRRDPTNARCLESYITDSLVETTQYSVQRLTDEHQDVLALLKEMQSNVQNLPAEDPYVQQQKLSANLLLAYANTLCDKDPKMPILHVSPDKIYHKGILTPTCDVPGESQSGSHLELSIRFADAQGQTRVYRTSGGSFSTTFLPSYRGSGEHHVSCSYRPNVCQSPRIVSQTVRVTSPVQETPLPHSVARLWNEQLLSAISLDRVRPPIQARNLFHFGAMLHDIWTLYHPGEQSFLVNTPRGGKTCVLSAPVPPANTMEETMSYAAYRLIATRFSESPGYATTVASIDALMNQQGYDPRIELVRPRKGQAGAALGNAVARCFLSYGLTDGSNESGSYANISYTPRNDAIDPKSLGNPNLTDWDHWQPISLEVFIDQGGNTILGGASDFLAAEWGNVTPFSLRKNQKRTLTRNGVAYNVYLDPGAPPLATGSTLKAYQWNASLTGIWSSHLDPADGVQIDISPASLGDTPSLPNPTNEVAIERFYHLQDGGTEARGRPMNPVTRQPYNEQRVYRGDYTRAIAEYWADGPKSETPPGHWFSLLNAVSDHPQLEKKLWGEGPVLSDLEWDVKTYFTLGGAMHDAAIAAWSIKGYYDGIRPLSTLRAMADHGQSTDPSLPSYDARGLPLVPGLIELIKPDDRLAGRNNRRVGQVKMRAWRGPAYIPDPELDTGGVDWILAANWWPYQRPSFVTPPFGGYISGHSTYSRAAAEVLTSLTGNEYFPGGLFEVLIRANQYLVFERGPSHDLTLQWATYRDAADACGLSRIWGGIHTPIDDLTGRLIGEKVGKHAVEFARHALTPSHPDQSTTPTRPHSSSH